MAYSSLSQHQDARFPDALADVRGFEVRTRDDDDKVGRVADLVCTADGSIRYLDVDLGGFFNPRHVVLPVGAAQVDRANDIVWITGMTKAQIKDLPDYTGDTSHLDDAYETRVRGAALGGGAAGLASSQGGDHELYDQGRFYAERGGTAARDARLVLSEERLEIGRHQVAAGEVAIRKTVETEHVRQTVPVSHEEVTIERHPITAESAVGDVRIGEDEIRVPLMREELDVTKRAVAVEEVSLRKQTVTRDETVEADLRRERAVLDDDVTRSGNSQLGASHAHDRSLGSTGDASTGGRLADKLDDLKDRVDGNPASRPGPDATDRPERF